LELQADKVSRIILSNVSGAVIFGWLYMKDGFEAVPIAHFSADVLLHGLLPALTHR
jgi:hypothetical protein